MSLRLTTIAASNAYGNLDFDLLILGCAIASAAVVSVLHPRGAEGRKARQGV